MAGSIVVVDDDRDVASAIAFAFTALGYEAHQFDNAPEALRAVIERRPELVLIDLAMPLIDGWELAQAIRALDMRDAPRLIAISGYDDAADLERSREAGFSAQLAKPIGIAELVRLVAVN